MPDDDTDEDGQRDDSLGHDEEPDSGSDRDRENRTDRDHDRDDPVARDDEFGLADDEFPAEKLDEQSHELSPGELGPNPAATGDLPGDGSGDAGGANDGEEDAPLSELRADVEERRETETDEDDLSELFREMDIGDVDEDTVWEELSEAAETPTVEPGAAVPEDDHVQETRAVTVVEKRLCHGCPHFSDPPETACTHDGTTIEAEVDIDHFRVVDCPVVAERENIE